MDTAQPNLLGVAISFGHKIQQNNKVDPTKTPVTLERPHKGPNKWGSLGKVAKFRQDGTICTFRNLGNGFKYICLNLFFRTFIVNLMELLLFF